MTDQDPILWNGPEAGPVFLFAHGAGAPMDSPFMERVALAMAEAGVRVGRFEFAYMATRRETGRRRPPDAQKVLLEHWRARIAEAAEQTGRSPDSICIGGKSMGGRMATMVADDAGVAGVCCFGYPFHPSGKPDKLRVDHLRAIETPLLILQGDRDPMGTREEVEGYGLASRIRVEWFADGNHDLMPRHKSGHTATQHQQRAARLAAAFVAEAAGAR